MNAVRRPSLLPLLLLMVASHPSAHAAAGPLRGNGVPLPAAPVSASPALPPTPAPSVGYAAKVLPAREDKALVLDATTKELVATPGAESCTFTFSVTNASAAEIVITQVRTSCGCSVAKLPSQPWRIAPGARGSFDINVDLQGKTGVLVKTATIDTARGFRNLSFKVTIPSIAMDPSARERNQALALANRQAVFKGDCAKCHAEPARGLTGAALYLAACAVCHSEEHRASMVPDLHALKPTPPREFWEQMITQGRPGTLMPAFADAQGGPLTASQIQSLVDYLTTEFASKQPPSIDAPR